jgi:hypothetical protein
MQRYAWNFELPADAECLGCRYPLAGVAQPACPECGRAFNPDNRLTYGPRIMSSTVGWALRGPGWGTLGAAAGVAVASALAGSLPLLSVEWFMLGLLGGLAVMGVSAVRAVLAAGALVREPSCRPMFRRGWWRWAALVALGLLSLGLVAYQPVWRIRWLVSRPAMDALAAQARANGPVTRAHWCGAIHVSLAQPDGNSVRVNFQGGGLLASTSLVHSPNAPPPVPGGGHGPFTLSGGWYLVAEGF